jgi:hypothetical protein
MAKFLRKPPCAVPDRLPKKKQKSKKMEKSNILILTDSSSIFNGAAGVLLPSKLFFAILSLFPD